MHNSFFNDMHKFTSFYHSNFILIFFITIFHLPMEDKHFIKHTIYPDDSSIITSFQAFKNWAEDTLDIFKPELTQLLYPLFIHIYLDLVTINRGKEFFNQFATEFMNHKTELSVLSSITDPLHVRESSLAQNFRSNKFKIKMGKYAFDIFMRYLEDNCLTQFLKIISHYFDIKVYIGKKEESEGLVGPYVENDSPLDLQTSLFTKETEDAILNDEKYKHDHLENFVQQFKKQQVSRSVTKPNATFIMAEIEKLKDLCKKVCVGKSYLPSICCYTVHNTNDGLTCAEISDDCKFIALGYQDSYIEIHALAEPLRKIKTSVGLGIAETNIKDDKKKGDSDLFEEIGQTVRLVGHSGPIYSLKFFLGNKSLLSCSQDCTIRLWSLELMTCIAVYKSHVFPVWSIDVADNYYFASGSADRTACIWSIPGSKPERLFVTALSDVTSVKFHPNSNYLFTGSTDTKIRMHSVHDGTLLRLFSGHVDGITCLSVSHCGKLLLSGSRDKTAILWDITTGKQIMKLIGHEKVVYDVGFCYFGSIIITTSADNTVRLWDRSDPKGLCLGVYTTNNTPLFCGKFGYRNIVAVVGPYAN